MPDPKTPDPDALAGEIYRHWEKAMTAWWDQVLESPSFLGGMGQSLAAVSQARGAYERAVDDSMEKLHLPTRADMVRLARVCTLLEERLLAQEDLLLAMKDRVDQLERATLEARVEAAEARLELRERLAALQDAIGAPQRGVAAPQQPPAAAAAPQQPPAAAAAPQQPPAAAAPQQPTAACAAPQHAPVPSDASQRNAGTDTAAPQAEPAAPRRGRRGGAA